MWLFPLRDRLNKATVAMFKPQNFIDDLKQQLERKVSDENQILESKQVEMLGIHARDMEKELHLVKEDLNCKSSKIMEL